MPPKATAPAPAPLRADANDEIQPDDGNVSDAGSRASRGSRTSRAARRATQRSRSRSTSVAGTFAGIDDGDSEASSSSSVAGAAFTRIKEAIGEAYPGFKNLKARRFCSEPFREMLDLAIKEKKITEDDGTSANVIAGFLRSAFQAQDLIRAAYEGSDAESLFQDEIESGALFLADIQLRAELPAAAAKTAYDTVVAKRDKRSFKATKSGVVFIFEEQAKIYEDYCKAKLKADTAGPSGRASSDQARALAGKDTAASAAKQLAAAKKKIEQLERREQGAQRRARQVEAVATAGGIELPKGQNQERSATRKRAPAAAGPGSA